MESVLKLVTSMITYEEQRGQGGREGERDGRGTEKERERKREDKRERERGKEREWGELRGEYLNFLVVLRAKWRCQSQDVLLRASTLLQFTLLQFIFHEAYRSMRQAGQDSDGGIDDDVVRVVVVVLGLWLLLSQFR